MAITNGFRPTHYYDPDEPNAAYDTNTLAGCIGGGQGYEKVDSSGRTDNIYLCTNAIPAGSVISNIVITYNCRCPHYGGSTSGAFYYTTVKWTPVILSGYGASGSKITSLATITPLNSEVTLYNRVGLFDTRAERLPATVNNITVPNGGLVGVRFTITNDGTFGDIHFTISDMTITVTYEPPHTHSYGNPTYTWSADGKSCTASRSCSCGNSTETATATVSSAVLTNATCLAKGTTRYTATFSASWASTQTKDVQDIAQKSHSYTGAIKSNGNGKDATHSFKCVNGCNQYGGTVTHTWNSGSITTQPTCTATGIKTYTCTASGCGGTYTETVAKLAHTEVTIPAVAATCTATGLTAGKKCSVCGTVTVAQTTVAKNPSNHTGSQVTLSAVAPTCEATGLTEGKKWSCCNAIITAQQTVPKLGHNYVGAVTKQPTCTEKGVKTYTCQNDASHKYTEEIPAKGHTSGTAVIENRIEATCTTGGSYDEVVYCTVCGAEISRTKKTIPAKGHSYTTQTFEPTETSAGYTRYTCSVCGYSYDTDYTYRIKIIVENGTVSGVVDGGIYAKGSKVDFTAIPDEGYEYRSAVVYYPDGSIRSFPYNTGRLEFIDNITFVVKFKSILPEITAVTITRSSDLAKVTISTPVDAGSKYIISVEVT